MGNSSFSWADQDNGLFAAYYNAQTDPTTGLISSFDLLFTNFSSDSSVDTWGGGCLMLCLHDGGADKTYDERYKAFYAGNWDITADPTIGTVNTIGTKLYEAYITYRDSESCTDCTIADSIELSAMAERYSTYYSTGTTVADTYTETIESMVTEAIAGTEQAGVLLNFKKSTPLKLNMDKVTVFDTDTEASTSSVEISTTKATAGSSGGY